MSNDEEIQLRMFQEYMDRVKAANRLQIENPIEAWVKREIDAQRAKDKHGTEDLLLVFWRSSDLYHWLLRAGIDLGFCGRIYS